MVENFSETGERAGQGSGFAYSSDGVVLTNYHVIRGAARVRVKNTAGAYLESKRVLAVDIEKDIAAVKVTASDLPALPVGDSSGVAVGDHIAAIGAPLGLEATLSDGLVSAIREAGPFRIIQISAPISPGSSGGPVLNDQGKVVALAVASMTAGQNLNFAVPVNYVTTMIQNPTSMSYPEMLDTTRVKRAVVESTFSVPPRQVVPIPFVVEFQQGAQFEGTFTVSGGLGNDVRFGLLQGNRP